MSDTMVTDSPPPAPQSPQGSSFGDKVRFVLRGIGQTLVTAGVVVLLFVVYEVYVTNLFADAEQRKVESQITKEFAGTGTDPLLPLPDGKDASIPLGTGFANLYIPRLGSDFHYGIVQGDRTPSLPQLEKGPAHYGNSQLPGQLGNFAVAGHRVGKGEPFLNLDKLQPGDPVIVETKTYWYVYRVKGQQHGLMKDDSDGVPGREIVSSADGGVTLPLPNHPDVTQAQAKERLMTMTTCHPKFTATHRMIVFAKLDATETVKVAATSGSAVLSMPASIKALYSEATS